jgi:molybdenum cofactor cytidylyltransferase
LTRLAEGTEAPVPVVILAAGASRRLGEPKQFVPFRGRSLLAHAIAMATAADCGPVLVVLGAGADALREEATGAGARVVENPDWATGMASSVRAAIAAVAAEVPEAEAMLFTVCDQPLVTADLLAAIVRAHRDGSMLVAAAYDGATGVPALFARRYFDELRELSGDVGARRVLARHAADVRAIPFPGGELDIDAPADVARLAAEEGPGRGGPTPDDRS